MKDILNGIPDKTQEKNTTSLKFKKDLIKIQKLVQKAESDFNIALQTEPIEGEFN